jgi:hypothetical protein
MEPQLGCGGLQSTRMCSAASKVQQIQDTIKHPLFLSTKSIYLKSLLGLFGFVFAVLGFELRAYTLSHSTSPFLYV